VIRGTVPKAAGPLFPGAVATWAAQAGLLMLAGLVALAGCDRKPRLVPAGTDSTAVVPADSTAVYVQMARDGWDSPVQADEAARLTARVLLADLRVHPGSALGARAREYMDSLAMGAEVAGGDPVVVNLFARSNPSGGSWPFLFWRDDRTTRWQPLEVAGMHLVGMASEPAQEANGPGAQRIAVLFSRLGPAGGQPFAFVWQRPPEATTWRLEQSLGADSLGEVGMARMLTGGPGEPVLESRTYDVARGFDECGSCPHVYRTRRFRWGPAGLAMAADSTERTPYYAFVQFIQALVAGDRVTAQRFAADGSVVSAAVAREWDHRRGAWRLAPGTAASARDLVLFRGIQEAYQIHFGPRGDDWVITGFEPTSRAVE
jgi:hypothetical protein